jgi:hypothetical protein
LKLKCDEPLSNVALNLNLRHYSKGGQVEVIALYSANKKGSMTAEKCLDYLNKVLLPSLRTVFADLASEEVAGKGFQGVEFCDGCQVHLSYQRLLAAKKAGLHVCLRVPHTTSETQGEDTVIFGIFKSAFSRSKSEQHRALEIALPAGKTAPLTMEHFGICLKSAWEFAFAKAHCKRAWERDGLIPFNRGCYWDCVLKVGRCRLTVSKPELKARLISALEFKM